ncbi:putative cysteine--tRNA ligase, mitochondrial [Takifugu flavidus]|uniref:Probable cysteine--tRNA ligase, mitochondrial n=1 Tax=Takifugu flavidus TaxID=433684 RepID=A0A5C6NBW1_9TELE|nr:putative cysteine--tRNA ligase, mitochondrial [Takifugu flavidus]
MWSPLVRSVLRESKVLHRLISSARSVHTGPCSNISGTEWTKPSGFDTGLTVFNSLTKQKEPLILAREGVATWYSCGPTVYDHAHLGHACSYVRFDIVQRILSKLFGITVIHAMVITDIDDKIIKRSWEENICSTVIASMYEEEFKRDMLSLKVIPPAVYLRVTENVPQIVAFIDRIIKNGHAYATQEGDVYFDIKSIGERYGKFGGAADSQPEPGELSNVKILKCVPSTVFGSQLDIHSGGIDLAFPHHENEIAQSEAYHQCGQWANYFLHSGHLHLKGSVEKMSKSLKNYITIKDFLKSYSANEFRMFCLLTKYRSAIDYSDGSMLEARSSLESISSFIHDTQAYMKGQLQCAPVQEAFLWERLAEAKSSVLKALAEDFDTARAVSAVMSLVHHGNRQLQPVSKSGEGARSPAVFAAIVTYIRDVLDVFGIELLLTREANGSSHSGSMEGVVEQLARFRSQVRAFALARHESATKPGLYPERIPLLTACDTLRNDLAPLGVILKDRGATSTWEITGRPQNQRVQDKDQESST